MITNDEMQHRHVVGFLVVVHKFSIKLIFLRIGSFHMDYGLPVIFTGTRHVRNTVFLHQPSPHSTPNL